VGKSYVPVIPVKARMWAIGLFEGEGSIAFARNSKSVTLQLAMTDRDVVLRFAKIVQCGAVHPRATKGKLQYGWNITSAVHVRRLLRQFAPHFGERRAARAAEALKRLANIKPHGYYTLGRTKTSG
jgi:hypothetical protein